MSRAARIPFLIPFTRAILIPILIAFLSFIFVPSSLMSIYYNPEFTRDRLDHGHPGHDRGEQVVVVSRRRLGMELFNFAISDFVLFQLSIHLAKDRERIAVLS